MAGMTKKEYLEFHRATCEQMMEICRRKNADYSGASEDPFANFRASEQLGVSSVETGFLVRMLDKFKRINSFVEKGELLVKDESVNDTLLDLANYSILLAGYIESKRRESQGGGLTVHVSPEAVETAAKARKRR